MSAVAWRTLVVDALRASWPGHDDRLPWIIAQIDVESSGDPEAKSPVGAIGLMQLMPTTWQEVAAKLYLTNPWEPAQNIRAGIAYLREQYEHLPEIPGDADRHLWALACYNGGRGYINRALAIARLEEPRAWWQWAEGRHWLMHRACRIKTGSYPDHLQIWTYVQRIRERVR